MDVRRKNSSNQNKKLKYYCINKRVGGGIKGEKEEKLQLLDFLFTFCWLLCF